MSFSLLMICRLIWDGELSVIVSTVGADNSLKGKLCGLCGRYNDDLKDEFEMPNGNVAKTVPVFAQSWQAPPIDGMYNFSASIIQKYATDRQILILKISVK